MLLAPHSEEEDYRPHLVNAMTSQMEWPALTARCFYKTYKGWLGVEFNIINREDEIVLIHGCALPYVIRPSEEERCRLVDGCYVHDVVVDELLKARPACCKKAEKLCILYFCSGLENEFTSRHVSACTSIDIDVLPHTPLTHPFTLTIASRSKTTGSKTTITKNHTPNPTTHNKVGPNFISAGARGNGFPSPKCLGGSGGSGFNCVGGSGGRRPRRRESEGCFGGTSGPA